MPKAAQRTGFRPAERVVWPALGLMLLTLMCPGALRPIPAMAQPAPAIGTIGEFAATGENYGPPHDQQPRWRLSGREAELLEAGRYRLKDVQLEFFRPTGEREAWLAAPECVHDAAQGRAHSAGPLKIRSGDQRAAIEGEGFLWEQTAATLILSNRIRATLQRPATNPPPAPLVVTSHWFVFEITNRRAVFHEQVRGEDADIEFTCGQLTVQGADTNAMFEEVQAEAGVAIREKATDRRITAARAIYNRRDDRAQLAGDVSWVQADQSGNADRVIFDRNNGSTRAEGRVRLRLPPSAFGTFPALGGGSDVAPLLQAEAVFSQTNFVLAEGQVRLQTGTNWLSCERFAARTDASRQRVEFALAEGQVRVQHGDGTLSAQRAEYVGSEGRIVFTGQPRWRDAQLEAQASRLTVWGKTGHWLAEQDVAVTLTLSGQSASPLALFPEAIPATNGSRTIQVFARSLLSEPGRAVFSGDVRAHQLPMTGLEPRLQCDTLALVFAAGDASRSETAGGRLDSITARGRVVCEQGQPGATNGPAMYRRLSAQTLTAHTDPASDQLASLQAEGEVVLDRADSRARAGRAAYDAQRGVLELSESPELETAQVHITGAHALVWDKTHDRYAMRGPFKARIRAEAAQQAVERISSP